MQIQKRIYEILGQAQNGDKVSRFVDRFLTILIITNVLAVSLESVETIGSAFRQAFAAFEMFSIIVFGTEYILRLWSAAAKEDSAYKTPFGKRIEYILSFNGLVDLAALLPSLISMFVGSADLRWIRVVRILRLLKMSNYSTALEDVASAVLEGSITSSSCMFRGAKMSLFEAHVGVMMITRCMVSRHCHSDAEVYHHALR